MRTQTARRYFVEPTQLNHRQTPPKTLIGNGAIGESVAKDDRSYPSPRVPRLLSLVPFRFALPQSGADDLGDMFCPRRQKQKGFRPRA